MSVDATRQPQLILFAKKPAAGAVKTRLQPPLSPSQAAAVADILLRQSVCLARQHWPGEIALAVTPSAGDSWWESVAGDGRIPVTDQAAGDLGQRMRHALEQAPGPAAVMGCDVPHCRAGILRRAYRELERGHNVIGPSLDGGYYLLGLQRPQALLFQGVEWGSGRVLAQTLVRAGMAGVHFHCLDALRDLDRWEDILAVRHRLPALDRYLQQQGLSRTGA